jgi:probable F420-dependent oxidoreductase
MANEHDALRQRIGRIGAWTFAFDGRPAAQIAVDARAIESLGFGALWVPEGGSSHDVLAHLGWLVANTERVTLASGIANITARQPDVLARGAALLHDASEGRIVLGIGAGHEYTTEGRDLDWARPVARMRAYLDRVDEAAAEPAPPRLLAALGDVMLRLAGERALGAHTYFVPPEHTERARTVLGPEPVIAVEQTVVLSDDPAHARAIARAWAVHYLELPNYANNWRRLGYSADDVAGDGSDRLIDAGIAWGSVDDVVGRVRAHVAAGADHVCVQVISADDTDVCLPQLRELAPALFASS